MKWLNVNDFSKLKIQRKYKENNSDWRFNGNKAEGQMENKIPKYQFQMESHNDFKKKCNNRESHSISYDKSSSNRNQKNNIDYSKDYEFEEKILDGEECLENNKQESMIFNNGLNEINSVKIENDDDEKNSFKLSNENFS